MVSGGVRRVMYVSHSGTLLGGAEVCLLDVATRVREAGWDVLVVVPHEGDLSTALAAAGVTVEVMALGSFRNRLETRSPILLLRLVVAVVAGWRLSRLIRARQVDLVHSNTAPVIAGALGAWVARVPHVWHLREILGGPLWPVLRWLMVHLAVRQVCISKAVAQNIAGAGVVVIADGVDIDTFTPAGNGDGSGLFPREADGRADTGPVVAMVSRLHPFKGHELFLRAAKVAYETSPKVRFLLVGGHLPAYEALRLRLLALRDELGLQDAASFVPFVERRKLPALLRQVTVVVVPSVWVEPGGLVVLEAMACGVPVVATRQGGPAEVITDGVDGLLVSPTDPAEMAGRITRLIRNPELRNRIGRAGRRRVEEAYSLNLHIQRLTAMYDEVLPS